MIRTMTRLAPLLILAACGGEPDAAKGDATPEATVSEPAPITLQPGKWRQSSELLKMEVPGMPPELARANIGQKTSFESCITPEQAKAPPSKFFTNAGNTDCTTKSFAMAGGKLDAVMTCVDKNTPGEMTMTIKGDYQPTRYTATMTMVTDGAPNGGEMKITATTTGERVGECDAKDVRTN